MSFISPIGAVGGVAPTNYLPAAQQTSAASEVGTSFGETLGSAVEGVQDLQNESRQLSVDAVTGELEDLHTATIASAQSSVALETISTFRNRGVAAFNEIMRMQA